MNTTLRALALAVTLFYVNCSSQPQAHWQALSDEDRPLPSCACLELITMADTTITGTKVYPASLAVPTPGDGVKAAVAPGAVRPGYRGLLNGLTAAQSQLYGRVARYRVWGTNNTSLDIERVGSFVVKNGSGDWQAYEDQVNGSAWGTAGTSTLINPQALYGAALTQGRYWIYISAPTGADPFDAVVLKDSLANRPDQNFMYRTNDQTKLLLSTFYVDSTGNMLPYRQSGGRFFYSTKSLTTVTGNNILNWGYAVASTAVNLGDSAFAPAPGMVTIAFTIRSTIIGSKGRGVASSTAINANFPDTVLTGPAPDLDLWFDGTDGRSATGSFEMAGANTFYYLVDTINTQASAWITGFQLW